VREKKSETGHAVASVASYRSPRPKKHSFGAKSITQPNITHREKKKKKKKEGVAARGRGSGATTPAGGQQQKGDRSSRRSRTGLKTVSNPSSVDGKKEKGCNVSRVWEKKGNRAACCAEISL